MKIIILAFLIFIITPLLYSQSNIFYEAGTDLQVETGADICADSKTINGTFSGGGTFCNGPLPVELLSFTSLVSMKGRDVTLIWKTGKEINNFGFNVERKMSGIAEWEKISFISGSGNSGTPVQYAYEDKKLNSGKYNYRLKQIDYNGNFNYFSLNNEIEISLPMKFNLSQNYPNPFNPSTKIDYDLPVDTYASLKIFDIAGREIKKLINEYQKAGYYSTVFNASYLASGVYFYRILAGEYISTKRMVLIK